LIHDFTNINIPFIPARPIIYEKKKSIRHSLRRIIKKKHEQKMQRLKSSTYSERNSRKKQKNEKAIYRNAITCK